MSTPILFLSLDVATMVCAALVGVRVLASWPRLRTAQLVALIAFDGVCDVVLGRYDYRYWIAAPYHFEVGAFEPFLNLARNLTPGLFMILSFLLFTDGRRFPRALLALLAVQMFLEEPVHWLLPAGWPFAQIVGETAPALLQTLFTGFALYLTVADWRSDLIEKRRRTRLLFSVAVGLDLIVSVLVPRVLIDPDTVANYYTHTALVASHLAIWIFLLFQLAGGGFRAFLDPARAPKPAPPKPADPQTAAALVRLNALLENEHIYRRPGLSLADLAGRVGLPEYRLRALIHEELGYPNFNAFLHAYRIREAAAQLRDPILRRTPILTIALSVGYQSVNTFNRGFREVMGMTPSAYRAGEKTTPENE
ncbi:MAG: helix-turn-helix transcriptional regulator [Rhizomicrobium sp.]